MYPYKGALFLILKHYAGRSVCLVTNDVIERTKGVAGLYEQLFVDSRNDVDGLVDRKYDGQPIGIVSACVLQLLDD